MAEWFKAPVLKFAFTRFVRSSLISPDVSLSAMTGLSVLVVLAWCGWCRSVGDHFGDHRSPSVHPSLPVWKHRYLALPSSPVASQRIIELSAHNGIVEVRLGGFVMTTRSASRASTFGRGL